MLYCLGKVPVHFTKCRIVNGFPAENYKTLRELQFTRNNQQIVTLACCCGRITQQQRNNVQT